MASESSKAPTTTAAELQQNQGPTGWLARTQQFNAPSRCRCRLGLLLLGRLVACDDAEMLSLLPLPPLPPLLLPLPLRCLPVLLLQLCHPSGPRCGRKECC